MSPARPRRGRVHETYSKDPYLLSLRPAYVRGLQIDDATTGVAVTTKPRSTDEPAVVVAVSVGVMCW